MRYKGYVRKTGAQWRMLPKDFPPWQTVYHHYYHWNCRGVWEIAIDELNELYRKKTGKKATPSYGIVDSQSAKTVSYSEKRGFDGGKKTKGRKRHIVIDSLGNLIQVIVHAANIHDTKGACDVLEAATAKHKSFFRR